MKFQKNDIAELEVIDLSHLGYGIAKPNGFAVFVHGAVTGDRVLAKIIKVNRSFAVARVEKLLHASAHRASDRCSLPCSACPYRDVDYEIEKQIKRQNVVAAFRKAGLDHVAIAPLLSDGKTAAYRNKAQYPIAKNKDGGIRIGFYAPRSHRVCEAAQCPLQPPVFGEILDTLRHFFEKNHISVYDETQGTGLLRHVYLRRGEISGEILLTLVLNGESLPAEQALCEQLCAAFPDIRGILINVNRADTNVILGDAYRLLWGRDYITDTMCGVRLSLSAPAFYQVNHGMAQRLYQKACALAAPRDTEVLLDLFCGTGSIGLSMAHLVGEVIGIEIVESAVRCAEKNARDNGIENASFYTGDATDCEHLLAAAERRRGAPIRPDIVLLDPPRKGCEPRLLAYVASLLPSRVVYISCNPETLARDCAVLRSLGYAIGEVTPVDLFPATGHVECVVLMTKVQE